MSELQRGPTPEIIERILAGLAEGRSMRQICRAPDMPARRTVEGWQKADYQLATRIMEAREIGYREFAERTLEEVDQCDDPIKARVILDARRWYLGKLSVAFADKPLIGVAVNVGGDDAFADIAGALERAAASIAGGASSTQPVALPSPAGSGDATGELADMAGARGQGMGENPDGR